MTIERTLRACVALFALGVGSLACSSSASDNTWALPQTPDPPPPAPPPNRHGVMTLEDVNPDPNIVEVNLVADHQHEWDMGKGTKVHGCAYNGANPGPIIEAKLGDRIIVHFENKLLWDTTVHWHGLRVPEVMDGTPRTQQPIKPGEKFTYEFVARDAGMYWYHPHHHEGAQIDLGLYGLIIVHAPGEPRLSLDQPMVLDDVLLKDGKIAGFDPHAHGDPRDTFDEDGDGLPTDRYGNTLLVNGRQDFVVPARAGQWALFRFVNTSNARYFGVHLEGHTMRVVGVDGGFLAEPYETKELRIGIGERYLVLVHLDGEPGKRYPFVNTKQAEDPFAFDPLEQKTAEIATLEYAKDPKVDEPMPVFPREDVPSFQATGRVDWTWALNTLVTDTGPINAINGAIWPNVPTPTFAKDGDYTFVVKNEDSAAHPWHLHGNRFQVLEVDGKPSPMRGWKDSVDVQPGSTLVLRTKLDNPGRWMVHCHILRHIEEGMTAEIVVQ